MLGAMITLKKYTLGEDAELARHQLEAAGIHAGVGGDNGNALFGGITNGGFCLEVQAEDKARALEVLAAMGQEDDISDAELEALAMGTEGEEHEVEPSPDEPLAEPEPERSTSQLAWRGFYIGAIYGLVFTVLLALLGWNGTSIASLTFRAWWRVPAFGLFLAAYAIFTKPSSSAPRGE